MKQTNRLAIVGCVLSICAAVSFGLAPACLMGSLVTPFFGYLFNSGAQVLAAAGIGISSVALDRAFSRGSGAAWSLAGLVTGVAVMGMSVVVTATFFMK